MPRPKKEINWEIVEKRMEAGCSGVEIASCLRVDSDTFFRRFREKYGKRFADSSADFYSAGDANIKFTQYMKALSGNNNMLMLLGKERLNQGKEEEIKKSPFEDVIAIRHENMLLKAELVAYKDHVDANQNGVNKNG
jgi:hypothetical protein